MIYHYTKGVSLKGILEDRFIATERKRGLTKISKKTDYVWLTKEPRFPRTALPRIPAIPSTLLESHYCNKNLAVDYDTLTLICAGLYRVGFRDDDARFKNWFRSDERKALLKDDVWCRMESAANKVGDNVRSFWISTSDVTLTDCTLEYWHDGQWLPLFEFESHTENEEDELLIRILISAIAKFHSSNGIQVEPIYQAA